MRRRRRLELKVKYEAFGLYWGLGIVLGLYRDNEKEMETIIMGYIGFRAYWGLTA